MYFFDGAWMFRKAERDWQVTVPSMTSQSGGEVRPFRMSLSNFLSSRSTFACGNRAFAWS